MPFASHSPLNTGSNDEVEVMTQSASLAASSADATGVTVIRSCFSISLENASLPAAFRL